MSENTLKELTEKELTEVNGGAGEISTDILAKYRSSEVLLGTKDAHLFTHSTN